MSEAWSLHPQLERDTAPVGDLVVARVLAINEADYPWLVLVPRRAGVVEVADLETADAARLMEEIALASRALRDATACDKLNIAAIGNIVPQLHVHIVARWKTDPLWPRPVWGHAPARAAPLERFHTLIAAVRAKLGAGLLAP